MFWLSDYSWILFFAVLSGVLALLLVGAKLNGRFGKFKPFIVAVLTAFSWFLFWKFSLIPSLQYVGGCFWDFSSTSVSLWCTPSQVDAASSTDAIQGIDLNLYSIILTLLTALVFVYTFQVQKELKEKKREIEKRISDALSNLDEAQSRLEETEADVERRVSDVQADIKNRRILQSRLELYLINQKILAEDNLDPQEQKIRGSLDTLYQAPGMENVRQYLDYLDKEYNGQFSLHDREIDYLKFLRDYFANHSDEQGDDDRVTQIRSILRQLR